MLSRVLVAGGVVSITSVYLYAKYLHRSLSVQVKSTDVTPEERGAAHASGEIECLPSEFIEKPQDFRTIHVRDEKSDLISIPASEEDAKKLFTKLLRRNMSCFSSTPQCWIMRTMAKTAEQKHSFSRSHIEALNFESGDLCCGFNRVLKRDPLKIEIELVPPEGMGSFSARLVINLRRAGRNVVLTTHTIQWTEDSAVVLPLDRGVAKFMHETASWWLIVSGLKYLKCTTHG